MPSEPGIGWQFVLATARVARRRGMSVLVVTNRRSYDAAVGAVPDDLAGVICLIPVDLPIDPACFRWHEPRFTRIEHEMWVRAARPVVLRLSRQFTIVYAQHVTFATEILTTPIVVLNSSVLKVWGPVGAGGVTAVFLIRPRSAAAMRQALLQGMRNITARIMARRVARRCDLVLAQNDAARLLLESMRVRTELFPNVVINAVTTVPVKTMPTSVEAAALDILCVGHLILRKRVDIAISAMTHPSLSSARLTIVGDTTTSHADELSAMVRRLGLQNRVTFTGTDSRDAVLGRMLASDVLFHPSGREGASGVVGEATALGLPVVCFEGTGASSVLRFGGGDGVVLRATPSVSADDIASALLAAASMPREPKKDLWTVDRFERLSEHLLSEARAHSHDGGRNR